MKHSHSFVMKKAVYRYMEELQKAAKDCRDHIEYSKRGGYPVSTETEEVFKKYLHEIEICQELLK